MTASFDHLLDAHQLALFDDPRCGRRLCTQRALTVGDRVFRCAPLALALLTAETTQRCHHCLRTPAGSLQRCSGCKYARYCNADCQRADWHQQHRLQCRRDPVAAGHCPEALLLLRTLLAVHTSEEQAATGRLLASLPHHFSDHPDWLLAQYREVARKVQQQQLARHYPELPAVDEAALVRLQCRFGCNNFAITDHQLHPVAAGVYPLASLMNHSCAPNCAYVFDGADVLVYALAPIRAGDELTISYVDVAHDRATRHSLLQQRYFFECRCERCTLPDHPLNLLLGYTNDTESNYEEPAVCDINAFGQKMVNVLLLQPSPTDVSSWWQRLMDWRIRVARDDSPHLRHLQTWKAVGDRLNQHLTASEWWQAAEAAHYRLAMYLLTYGLHPLAALEALTAVSCIWNSQRGLEAAQQAQHLLGATRWLMQYTHPEAQHTGSTLQRQLIQLHVDIRKEITVLSSSS